MGEVLVKRLLGSGLVAVADITVSDQSQERLTYLAQTYKIRTTVFNAEAIAGVQLVILAIKPQHAKEALRGLASYMRDQLFLSIMAGVPMRALASLLGTKKIVRSMPNMPAQIGEGMTVWCAATGVSEAEKQSARAVLRLLGREIEVRDEIMIDAATALSGSGPAYVFDFAAHLIAAARELGFSAETAKLLVAQTLKGSAQLLMESPEDAAALRQKVTSKGGTTEAAFEVLDKKDFGAAFSEALRRAHERAKALARLFDRS